jgi:uncharacterized protein YkwD
MPPSKSAEKKSPFRTLSVLLLAAALCTLPLSCAHRAPEPSAALQIDSGPAALPATVPPAPEQSTAPVTASPAGTPAVTATPAPTSPPAATASPSPTPAPTPTPELTPMPTAKPAAKSAAKTAPKKTRAPTAKPKATATPAPASGGVKAQENKMISLVNEERKKEGLAALKYDGGLRAGALKHSNFMSKTGKFDHFSDGSFSDRLAAAKIKYTSAGENIAKFKSIGAAHTALMNSQDHRDNILNPKFTRIGIGIVYNKSNSYYYITQWFAK